MFIRGTYCEMIEFICCEAFFIAKVHMRKYSRESSLTLRKYRQWKVSDFLLPYNLMLCIFSMVLCHAINLALASKMKIYSI